MKKIFIFIVNIFLLFLSSIKYFKFAQSINKVKKVQKKKLFTILKNNSNTKYGQKFKFGSIKSIKEFQDKVPLTNYEDYKNDIDLIIKGKKNILTKDKVILLEPSSGSTSASKLIPYTKSLKKEFQKGILPWFFNLYFKNPALLLGKAYWSISPASKYSIKDTKVLVGFEDDTGYFGLLNKILLDKLLIVPKELSRIHDIDAFRYTTILFLLKEKNLSFISVWHPSFLTLLLDHALKWRKNLIDDIRQGTISNFQIDKDIKKKFIADKKRAAELDLIFLNNKKNLFVRIWPNLKIISCWGDANAENYITEINKYFSNVKIQKKGLISTEGFISFPLENKKNSILSINSHFFEFIDRNQNVKLAHELEKNQGYSVVITTSGGFYRYQLNDLVEVVSFKKQCPLIKFIGKEDMVSDLFGEKINEKYLFKVLNQVFNKYKISPTFYFIAPEKEVKYFYCLFLELKNNNDKNLLRQITKEIEQKLIDNYNYKYCRDLGQLDFFKLFIICEEKAIDTYFDVCRSYGKKLGNIKAQLLDKNIGWSKKFKGYFLN